MKKTVILGLLFAVFGVSSAHGITQTWTWTGGGTDNNWMTTSNWTATIPGSAPANGGFEDFGGSTRLTPYNNENNLHSNGIMFESGASAFTLTGNGISMEGAAGIANDSSSTETVGMAITLTVSQQFSATDGPLVFSSTIDGAYNLMLFGPFSITLGAVGGVTPLNNLTATGGPVTIASITASGNVDFSGSTAVQLGSDPTVQSTGGNVNFGTATFQGNGNSLMLSAATTVTLDGALSGVDSLTVTGLTFVAAGGAVTTTGDQTYGATVSVANPATFTSSGGNIIFHEPVQGNGNSLMLSAAATVTLDGALSGVDSLTVSGLTVTVAGGAVTTTGDQTYGATVAEAGPTTLTSSGGNIIFHEPVQGNGNSLMLSAAATVTLDGALSGVDSLTVSGLTVTVAGGAVTTTGDQTFTATVSVANPATFTSSGGNIIFHEPVQGNGNSVTLAAAGMVTFNGPVTAVHTLDVTGSFVNNSTIQVPSGATLELFGPAVNNGTIDAFYGTVIFHSTFSNYGTIITSNCPPIITSIAAIGPDIQISFTTCSNVPYEVDYDTDLVSGTWTPMTNLTAISTNTTVIDSGAALLPKRFYRAGLVLQ